MSLWKKITKPILVQAPMEDVTDTVFRQVIAHCKPPDVYFTEFTNCEGLQSIGQEKIARRLKFSEIERPIVAQIWGITPDDYFKSAKLIAKMGFDGLDINMGCPVRNVIKQGACSALIKNHKLAKEIVEATKAGLEDKIPLSIKTRIGFKNIATEEWIGFLLSECRPNALTVHARTVVEQSKVPNHWEEMAKLRDLQRQTQKNFEPENQTTLIGNGDIQTYQEAIEKARQYELDGMMIGRALLKNPWFFDPNIQLDTNGTLVNQSENAPVSPTRKIELLRKHLQLWNDTWVNQKPFQVLKKYFKIYISGFKGSSELREKLMNTSTISDAENILDEQSKYI